MLVLMDYLAYCEWNWRPGDANVEADDLTNQIYDKFDLNKRQQVSWEDLEFQMMNLLLQEKVKGDGTKFKKSEWGWESNGYAFPLRN